MAKKKIIQKLFAIMVSKQASPVSHASFQGGEKELQKIVSGNLMSFFGASRLDDEWSVGDSRIDTIGIDQDHHPIIIEYKKGRDYNVVNQALSYYHDLLDHKSDFRWLVTKKLGAERAENIKLNKVRLVCIAKEFAKFDLGSWRSHKNVELITYRYFDNNTLLFEWAAGKPPVKREKPPAKPEPVEKKGRMRAFVEKSDPIRRSIFDTLCQMIEALAPTGIEDFEGKQYFTYKKEGKNFVWIRACPDLNIIRFSVKLDPGKEKLDGKICKKGKIGGSGKILAELATEDDLKEAFPLIEKAFELI